MVYNNLINCNYQHLPKKMDQEKKMKREIANSNERRRMQSINAGFNSLRAMLPHHDNEKLSKVSCEFLYTCLCYCMIILHANFHVSLCK